MAQAQRAGLAAALELAACVLDPCMRLSVLM